MWCCASGSVDRLILGDNFGNRKDWDLDVVRFGVVSSCNVVLFGDGRMGFLVIDWGSRDGDALGLQEVARLQFFTYQLIRLVDRDRRFEWFECFGFGWWRCLRNFRCRDFFEKLERATFGGSRRRDFFRNLWRSLCSFRLVKLLLLLLLLRLQRCWCLCGVCSCRDAVCIGAGAVYIGRFGSRARRSHWDRGRLGSL